MTNWNEFMVLCYGNSSCNFKLIPLQLYRCYGNGLKMCISLGYNPHINFLLPFFTSLSWSFRGIITFGVYRKWIPCVCNSYDFMLIILKHYMCLCHGLKMRMIVFYIYNPQISFVTCSRM